MRVSPDSWLLNSDTLTPAQLAARAEELTARENSLVADVSDFYEIFDIEGKAAREVIAAGCAVDFEIAVPPMAAPTRLSHFDVIIAFITRESFRVLVARSFADDLETWLNRAAKFAHRPDLERSSSMNASQAAGGPPLVARRLCSEFEGVRT